MPGNAVAAIELQDPLGDVVEKIAIVGDRDDSARVFLEITLQPGNGQGVQMVGRLVEQQHVRRGQQQPAQGDAALFTAGQRADHGLPRRQAQGIGCDLELAFQFPTAGGINGVLQLCLFLEQRGHLVIGHRLSELAR